MVTDGITEARASDRELFSMWRVADYVRDNGESPIQQMVDGLLQTATSYAGGELQDDAAIVIVKHTCKPTKNIHSNHKETYNCSV
jgi:serine phosphatase RsbU (regulator of sigma subunit)